MELISRDKAVSILQDMYDRADSFHESTDGDDWAWEEMKALQFAIDTIRERKEGEWEWCHDCKEYDQERHCCHRWSNAIRKTVAELEEHYGKYITKHDKTLVIDYPNTDDVEVIRLMDDEGFTRVFVER